ncbi:hypothetical protein ACQP0C_02635 [Nocardia sp. CA-129566]
MSMLTQRAAKIRSFDLDAGAIRLEFFERPRLELDVEFKFMSNIE